MLLRRHRASLPDVDPAFDKTPHETVDPAFTDPNLTSTEAGEQPETPANPVFDPSLHNAEKVLEHAAALDAEGLEALTQAEAAGKARKGVLEALAKFWEKEREEAPGTPGDPEAPDPGDAPSKDDEGAPVNPGEAQAPESGDAPSKDDEGLF